MTASRHLLVRSVNWLGDAVMAMPALQRLREALPHTRITVLTHQKLADLWALQPAVDAVIPFAADETVWRIGRRLRALDCDTALVLPNSPRSALECWLARIPRRIGRAGAWRRLFLTEALPDFPGAVPMRKRTPAEVHTRIANGAAPDRFPAQSHHAWHYLHLASALGARAELLPPWLAVPAEELARIKSDFVLPLATPLLGLVPGAEYGPAKRWPADRFAAVAQEILRRHGCHCVIFGGARDAEVAATLTAALPPGTATNLAGRTTLRQLVAALAVCRVVLTNDTGPMHLAAAAGAAVVVPFGSTSADLTGPGLPDDTRHQLIRAQAPCSPCFLRECPVDLRCMMGITVEQVTAAVDVAWHRAG